MLKSNLASALLLLAVPGLFSTQTEAAVTLQLRPTTQLVLAGQPVEVALYAVANPAQPIGVLTAVLHWDPADLIMQVPYTHGEGAYPWNALSSGVVPPSGGGLDPATGYAYYFASVTSCDEYAMASPTGLKVATFRFNAGVNTGPTLVEVLANYDVFQTEVYDGLCGGQPVTVGLDPAVTVTIGSCGSDQDCDDGNACRDPGCAGGVCFYELNYPGDFFCCDPDTGDLALLSDDDDCTKDECDLLTGQVTHSPEDAGTACGDPANTACTSPDTCDAWGVCKPNHKQNGNFCVNNCTEGPDTCLDGVCDGGGDNPCPLLNPAHPFCKDQVVEGDPCPDGDGDCDTANDFWCVDGICTRPYACVDCETTLDCPDSGNCYNYVCFPNGSCTQVVLDSYCQDGLLCNGEEYCDVDDFVGHCVDDLLPPCPDEDCREETCCLYGICDELLCECVECVQDTTCDDEDPCTGTETCDLVNYICLPGTPPDCSYLDDDCNIGVCNSATGDCEADVIDEMVGVPGSCDDGEVCTLLDACTADGGCVGEVPPNDGPVDLGWAPVSPVTVDETFTIDLYASSDAGRCELSHTQCSISAQDCSNVCESTWAECDVPEDCPAGDFCQQTQDCIDGHHTAILEALIKWDPTVLELVPGTVPEDPCESASPLCRTCADTPIKRCTDNPLQDCEFDANCQNYCDGGPNHGQPCGGDIDCPDGSCEENLCVPYCMCTDDTDCTWGGHRCFCPTGAPCAGDSGVCITGKYDWAASYFPNIPGTDPDGINDTWTDGDAKYQALAQVEIAKAGLFLDDPLWVTSIEFKALAGTTGTDVEFIVCTGAEPSRTRVLGDGAGEITGELVAVTVQVVECTEDGDCDDTLWCTGTERCVTNVCVPGSDPCPGRICIEAEQRCVDCVDDPDCEDGAVCTVNTCVDETCVVEDLCPDDGLFCTGTEYCDVPQNMCKSTGDPCPPFCDEVNDTCPCAEPIVEAVGPRYLAITPQPPDNPVPVAFMVSSPDWPCLNKYVGGFLECGDTGKRCQQDADCNQCDEIAGACLTDVDCRLCTDFQTRCYTNEDCPGSYTCTIQHSCLLSGNTCDLQPLSPIDVDNDGLDDGIVATLVDDPLNAASMTPEEWGTLYQRCSLSFEPCTSNSDCVVGTCSSTGSACDVVAQNCPKVCAIAQTDCEVDVHCPPGDACTGVQNCDDYETCDPGRLYVTGADILPSELAFVGDDWVVVPTEYEVWADCGGLLGPVEVTMPAWSDADRNNIVSFDDIQAGIMAFEGRWPSSIPARTVAAVDIVGNIPCVVEQVVSFDDISFTIFAFQGEHYNPDVLSRFDECHLPCP